MTQKRGLGRGLGALIPGAGTAPAPSQDLRTRSHPRTSPEAGEKGASTRPVDMFFSGDPVQSDAERPQRERASKQDLAGDMARAAAQRRGRGSNGTTGAKRTTGDANAGEAKASTATSGDAAASASKSGSAKSTTATSGTAKSGTSKSGTSKSGTTKSGAARSSTAKSGAARSGRAKSGTTKSGATTSGATKTATSKSTASKPAASTTQAAKTTDATADSPVVDVEEVQSTPVTAQQETTADPVTTGPASVDPATVDPASADPASAAAEETTSAAPQREPEQRVEQPASPVSDAEEGLLPVPGAEFAEVPIHEIRENPRNPRTMFDEDELDELAESLQQVGVLQPVVIRPIPVTEDGESFELVMGERRWRAARRAGLDRIPAIIRETSDDDLLRDALLENLHRSQLNPLEEAAAYQQLLEDFGCTQEELSARIGRSRPQITNTLRLMRLPGLVQRRLASGAISAGHARALLSLDDPSLMEELAQRIVQEGLSVRAVERLVARGGQPTASRTPRRSTYDPHVVDITSRLSNRLEAPVRIDVGKRKGKITLEFSTIEDLERLAERIGLDLHGDTVASDDQG